MKYLLGIYNKSIVLTYLGVALSILGIYLIWESIDIAIICMILAGICDLFDGKLARMCKRSETEKAFGVQIDSLADTVSFLVFPAVFLMYASDFSVSGVVISVLYVLMGIIRLAWFNVTVDDSRGYFNGLPVTYSALIIPAFYAINSIIKISFSNIILQLIYISIAVLFILNIKIKKPHGVWYAVFSVLAVSVIIAILAL